MGRTAKSNSLRGSWYTAGTRFETLFVPGHTNVQGRIEMGLRPPNATAGPSAGPRIRLRYAGTVTFIEAAEQVLRASQRPLSATEITELAMRRGLLQTKGQTPAATMRAALYGAPPGTPIRRESTPGRRRAARNSARWVYEAREPTGKAGI